MACPIFPNLAAEEIFIILPLPAFLIILAADWRQKKTPVRFTSMTCLHCCSVILCRKPSLVIPALLTKTSRRPNSSTTRLNMPSTSDNTAVLATTLKHFAPIFSTSLSVSFSRSLFTSLSTTIPPSLAKARAAVLPIPWADPVINTTLSLNSISNSIFDCYICFFYFALKPNYSSFPQMVTPMTQFAGNPPRFCVRPSRGFFICRSSHFPWSCLYTS